MANLSVNETLLQTDIYGLRRELEALRAENEALRSACQLAIDMFVVNEINVPNTIETLQDALQTQVVNSKFTTDQESQAAKGE